MSDAPAVRGCHATWDSADADPIGDMRRFIEAERDRVYRIEPSWPPFPVSPAVYEAMVAANEAARQLEDPVQRMLPGLVTREQEGLIFRSLEDIRAGRY